VSSHEEDRKKSEEKEKGLEEKNASTAGSSPNALEPEKPAPQSPKPKDKAVPQRARPASVRSKPADKEEKKPEEPSPLEPVLKRFKQEIVEKAGEDAVVEDYINRAGEHIPTFVIAREKWLEVARLLKEDPLFSFDYLRNLSAVDYQKEIEVVYQFYSFKKKHQIAIRVKTDRDEAKVPSVAHLWKAADWNEREAYDLMGVVFEGHPNLKRILLPDEWVGHPLRKDYEPLDKEV
jgi:NADH-quinone oxidoreductase subunit C